MSVTLLTFHEPISWLKEVLKSIPRILVTLLTSQPPIFWLKDDAPLNISTILVTLDTSQELISALKSALKSNASLITVTWLTSQVGIDPYSDVVHKPSAGLVVKQVLIASWKLASVIAVLQVVS